MKSIWEILNGKKVNIGATMLLISTVIRQSSAIWGLDAVAWIAPVCDTLDYIGATFAGVGLGHKAVK